ncbi:SigB/SigF/SigG family RNA polymerase sigma factor [Catellatospora sp. NPDC049133]|jgi:RNA polymerase sigma-B factor|uniref:SigB/SigF/SigG family RNA polymerase sigma factor n=1 Tax=Catellatospora sp. NPDC049133 TaxID=3155499 RepID=UPI00340D43B4
MTTSAHVTTAQIPPEQPDHWRPRPRSGNVDGVAATLPCEPHPLLELLHALPTDDPQRVAARASVIEWYLPMTGYLARRFARRGEPVDDIAQVAAIGLIKAVDRYDVTRGVPFAGYAIPTIMGEIKRHFRDSTWNVRVPRRLQELCLQVASATDELTRDLQGSPSSAQLAARLRVGGAELGAARRAGGAYRLLSLDKARPGSDEQLSESLAVRDTAMAAAENRMLLQPLLARLPARDRRIIVLRFYDELTQSQIAAQLGVSQMHVSRLLSHALSRLRGMA